MVTRNITQLLSVAGALGVLAVTPVRALAHCDGLDGPVVKAAQRALETRNPAFALIWVEEMDEREIRPLKRFALKSDRRPGRTKHHPASARTI